MEISDIIALVNCVLTGLFLVATVVSVVYAFKAYRHQKDRARKEAACELARYYAEDVILRHSFVTSVMRLTDLEPVIKHIFPYDELSRFDRDELGTFLKTEEMSYEEVEAIFMLPDPQAILNVKLSLSGSAQEYQELVNGYIRKDPETGEKSLVHTRQLQNEFRHKVQDFLNALEWFSMSCRYGIADEEILYQSLHKTFLSIVWQLYFYICRANIRNEDKLYTNIIWLFDKWRDRLREIQKKAKEKQDEAVEYIHVAERILEEAERSYENAKPEIHAGKPLKK